MPITRGSILANENGAKLAEGFNGERKAQPARNVERLAIARVMRNSSNATATEHGLDEHSQELAGTAQNHFRRSPPPPSSSVTPAVVVGLCAHGLGIVRELARKNVPVIALESNLALPGARTRHAQVRQVADINSTTLIDDLDALAATFAPEVRPVLFLTNDRMVQILGEAAQHISRRFRLSWAHAATRLLPLLSKSEIEARCAETGLNYPKSHLAHTLDEVPIALAGLRFPVIAKPVQPLSAFKTLVAHQPDDLVAAHEKIAQSLPVLLQEFIPGGDDQIQFGALYLDHGKILARFEGRKLHSRPMGHTTIGISEPSDEVHALTARFFNGLELSGPVSLELKRAEDGSFWVIEPTVGRTDFWAGLCSANGVPLALIEYLTTLEQPSPSSAQFVHRIWVNGERFPGALMWLLRHDPNRLGGGVRGVYLDFNDPAPFIYAVWQSIASLPGRVVRKAGKQVRFKTPQS